MGDVLAAALAPETLEVGIHRAITRALESGQGYVTLPESHLGYLAPAIERLDLSERSFCCLADPVIYNDGYGRVTLCLEAPGPGHNCVPRTIGHRIRNGPGDHLRSYLVSKFLDAKPWLENGYIEREVRLAGNRRR